MMISSFGEKKLREIGVCKDEWVEIGEVTALSMGQFIPLPCLPEEAMGRLKSAL